MQNNVFVAVLAAAGVAAVERRVTSAVVGPSKSTRQRRQGDGKGRNDKGQPAAAGARALESSQQRRLQRKRAQPQPSSSSSTDDQVSSTRAVSQVLLAAAVAFTALEIARKYDDCDQSANRAVEAYGRVRLLGGGGKKRRLCATRTNCAGCA